jgi:carboxypeptidase family protein/TonB-dependent receptor-like protein
MRNNEFGYSLIRIGLASFAMWAAFFFFASEARGQGAGNAALTGTITDQNGAVIGGAQVMIKNADTGIERTLATNDEGLYTAPLLQPGTYEIRVIKEGFAVVIRKDIHLAVGQTLVIDLRMPLKAATESITVTGEAGVIDTEKSEVSTLVDQAQVENLPLNGRRWDNLVLLTPGVSEDGGFGGVSFRGISSLYNNNMVDGSDNNQAFFAEARGRTRLPYGYSLDAIKEFQVTNAVYSAEYGRAAGGVVNAITRSGGNDFHGDAFYFVRDQAFLAQDPRSKELGQKKPDERRQQFGGSFGGSLVKNKLFYFLNYDQQKRNFPAVIGPFSSGSYAREIDPANCTSPNCAAVIAAFNALTFTTNPRNGDNYIGLGKVDYQLNNSNRISAVFNILRWNSPNGILTGPVLTSTELSNGTDRVSNEFITTSWNSTISQTLVNDFRFQYGRDFESQSPNASGPNIQITGGANIGMPNFLPRGAFPNEKRFQWVDTLSWVKGRNVWKFGADINYVRDKIQNLFQGGGVYSYNDSFTGTALTNPAMQKLADDLANGTRQYASFTQAIDPITGSGKGFFTTADLNFFLQDNIKVLSNFTLNLGLRYEEQIMPRVAQANPLVPETGELNTDSNNFGPRVGFSYGIGHDQKTVLRGGYGIYYGRTQNSSIFVSLFQNGVFQQTFRFTPTSCGAPVAPNLAFPQPATAPAFTPIFGSQGGPTPTNEFNSLQDFLAGCPTAASQSSVVDALSPDFVAPLVHEYDLGVERELPGKLSLTVSLVGARGLHLPVFVDANLPQPNATRTYSILDSTGTPTGQFTVPFFSPSTVRLNPNVGVLLEGRSVVNSWYNGLVLDVKRRISHGFSFDANFTWSQARDTGEVAGVNGTFAGTVRALNPNDLRAEAGLSEIDIRRRLIINTYWETPFANWTDSQALKHVVGGWRFSTIWRIQDGRPVEADLSGRPNCGTRDGGLTCGAVDGNGLPVNGRVPFFPRNAIFTGPGFFDTDMRISREFRPTERIRLQFLWEAFNILNRYNPVPSSGVFAVDNLAYGFSACAAPPGVTDFGGCLTPRASFLSVTSTGNTLYTARQMQLGLKFSF